MKKSLIMPRPSSKSSKLRSRVHLLSHPICKDTPLYAGEGTVDLKRVKMIDKGNPCNTMHFSFPNHTGTHVDVPYHFSNDGASITDIRPSDWIFHKISMVETPFLPHDYIINKNDIKTAKDCELLLIKTNFEQYRGTEIYWRNSPGLDPALGAFLKTRCPSLRAVGINTISISNLNNRKLGREAHRAFLNNGIMLLEDMKLSGLEKVPDIVVIAPLLIAGADGAPCTAFGIYN